MKNEDSLLPLDKNAVDTLALVGPEPDSFRIDGGGSSEVSASRIRNLRNGIEELVGDDVSITSVSSDPYRPVGPELVSPPGSDQNGFQAEYFSGSDVSGDPASSEVVDQVMYDAVMDASDIAGTQSIRWTAEVAPDAAGTFWFQIERSGAATLYVDDDVVVEKSGGFGAAPRASGEIDLEEGETYELRLEIVDTEGGAIKFRWDHPDVDPLNEAVQAAGAADAAIAVVRGHSSEGSDREDMALNGDQDELVQRVAGVNDRSIVLVNTGGPVQMPWIDAVSSTMFVGYPGQEAGPAVADLLFGEATPTGKLPMTFGETMDDYPADEPREYPGVDGTVHYDEGGFVGYRYFDETDTTPLFPFGHGESYTDFEYARVHVTPRSVNSNNSISVEVDVANVGDRDGTEVVQVYVNDVDAPVERPPKELKGFARVDVPAGETRTVEIELDDDAFEYWDPATEDWTRTRGTYELLVGSSSRDIRQVVPVNG